MVPREIEDVMSRLSYLNAVGITTHDHKGLISIYPVKGVDNFDFIDVRYVADGPNDKPGFSVSWFAPDCGTMTSGDIFVEYEPGQKVEGNARTLQTQVISTSNWIRRIYDKLHI